MVWKPKEKDLTLEEAVELAQKTLAPYWFGTTPQIAGVPIGGGKFGIYELSEQYVEQVWMVILADPNSYSGRHALEVVSEFHRRYEPHDVFVTLILTSGYSYYRDPENVKQIADSIREGFYVAFDVDQSLARGFNTTSLPKIVVTKQHQRHIEAEGVAWLAETELKLQEFLRQTDPGLPLLPVLQTVRKTIVDSKELEFGYLSRKKNIDLRKTLETQEDLPEVIQFETGPGGQDFGSDFFDLKLRGKFFQDAERLIIKDSNASIQFRPQSEYFAIVAQPLSISAEPFSVKVEYGEEPIYDSIIGSDLVMDDEGNAVIHLGDLRMYEALVQLKNSEKFITLSFERADRLPIALYGLRFGMKVENEIQATRTKSPNLFF